jgi:hypothetical protein
VATTPVIERFVGDTNVGITDQILVGGAVFDFTGAAVPHLRVRAWNGVTQLMDVAAAWTSITTGQVTYTPGGGDVIITTAGLYTAWWYIPTMSTGKPQTGPPFYILVADPLALPNASDLCTIGDVRSMMELQVSDQTRDAVIAEYISEASLEIMRYADREFAPATASATRRFHIDPASMSVQLQGYDLRSVTSITVNPETAGYVLSAANDDYELLPLTPQSGTYKSIQISRTIPMYSTHRYRYGRALCDVAGAWGFATVPLDARKACIQTVRSWLDRSVAAWGMNDLNALGPGMNPQAEGSFGLPPSALRTLKNYRPVLIA